MRKLYWYLTAYLRKHGLVFLLSLAGAIVLFSFFISSIANQLTVRRTHYIGLIGSYTLSTLPNTVTQQISTGLTTVNADGSVAPMLAERWTLEQEKTAYRFLIKENLRWQDGKIVEPADINYQLNNVEVIATPNDLVFKLPNPFSPFPTQVSEPVLREGVLKVNRFFTKPTLIGIGPYRIQNYTQSASDRLEQLVVQGPDSKYIYRFYLTEDEAINAFKRGEVDLLPDLATKPDVADWPNVKVSTQLNFDQYLAVLFNHRDPIMQKNVRQALAYATPKPTDNTRALGPISPNSWAYLAGGKSYDLDLDRASERLRDELPNQPLEFSLTTTSLYVSTAEKIIQSWENLGERAVADCEREASSEEKPLCANLKLKVELRITNFPDTNNFQSLLIGQEIPSDPDQYDLWHSTAAGNITGYKNTRIDNLLEKGRQAFAKQERKEIYQEFQQFLLEDAPAIFLEYIPSYRVERV